MPLTPPLVLLACGGYRSGSTLAYNLLGEHAERSLAGARLGYVEPEQVPLLDGPAWSFVEALGVAVAKAHHSPAIPEGADWSGLLARGRLLPVLTLRDWRDVLHSFCRAFGQDPAQALASRRWRVNLDNVRWWRDAGALLVPYDDLVAHPADVLARVWTATGLPLDERAAAAAVRAAAAVEAGPADAMGDAAHGRTLLHEGHVATPGGGGWRAWPADVLAEVEDALAPVQADLGVTAGTRGAGSRPGAAG
ncbi:hypothetical protein [Vallicoccus soli]|uniref:Sulfotransferase family protein n=1 Tax=Vallicoccus soli TaxID=2339232 RepID=A0A3A3YSZ8_9ACTN|nr:hypothetical protein [Vallicoccus soli]RJK93820.1 hypothetical protein D5H78_15995 [Vallicoccus soli]